MNNLYLGLKFAISYFTILPVKFKKDDDLSKKEILGMMMTSLPFIGLLLGFITVVLYFFLDSTPWLGAVISACIYFVLYGFIHTEAILDVADAIYAKHSGKDAYKVIKEPTIGAMGFLYALVLVILKIVAIVYLFSLNLVFEFISILIISRMSVQFVTYFFAFRSSFLTTIRDSFSSRNFLFSLVIYSLIILSLTKVEFLWFIPFAFILSFFIAKLLKKNLGFLNGDTVGVILELIETILFILVAYLWV